MLSDSSSAGKIQEVILQEHLEKEDEVLVSLAGLKQVSMWAGFYSDFQQKRYVFQMRFHSPLFCWPWSSQIKDILKGSLRFNQSQLEAEENEEITIADDHYTSTAAAETALNSNIHYSDRQQQRNIRQSRDSDLDGSVSMDEKEEEEQGMTPPEQQVS